MTSIISTHTLTWSVTANAYITKSGMANFNSHAHVERDKTAEFKQRFYAISTHTLTWSVTGVTTSQQMIESISTHTLTWSVTSICKCFSLNAWISTHTLTWSVTKRCKRAYIV